MRTSSLWSAAALALATLTTAAPLIGERAYSIPTTDGFPKPNAQQLIEIQRLADGTLSNAPPPAKLNASSLVAFQLIAFNEQFEVAFFRSLLDNITANVEGYGGNDAKTKELKDVVTAVLAQEELHAINAVNVLTKFNSPVIPQPCQYKFPTNNVFDAIRLAQTFTSLVLGTLQDASQLLAKNGDDGPVRAVASVIGQEGEQNGFYRIILSRKPSEKPFLTTSIAPFAFSALVQNFIVPDSCPFNLNDIKLPVFATLSVLSGDGGNDVDARDQTLTFSADLTGVAAAKSFVGGNGNGLFVTYLTGQNLPISQPVQNVQWNGNVATFEAFFPFNDNVMDGLSIAALTTAKDFPNPGAIAAATLAAPGLIQVNDEVNMWTP